MSCVSQWSTPLFTMEYHPFHNEISPVQRCFSKWNTPFFAMEYPPSHADHLLLIMEYPSGNIRSDSRFQKKYMLLCVFSECFNDISDFWFCVSCCGWVALWGWSGGDFWCVYVLICRGWSGDGFHLLYVLICKFLLAGWPPGAGRVENNPGLSSAKLKEYF